jgi:heavy metal efflux system protein
MLNSIIAFSLRNKVVVALGVLLLIFLGIYQLRRLPIDALPDITSNQVQVITISPALAAPEVERLITFNIEQSCANIPGLTEMRSISRFGLSVVTIVFSDKTDIYWARQQVAERMILVRELIPVGAGIPELAPLTTGLGEVFQYFLQPQPGYENKYSLSELRSMQDWIVRRQLLGTAGVADVSSFGGYLKQYEVAVDPHRLNSMGVDMSELFAALEVNNQNSGGAYIEKGPTAQFIRTEGLARSVEDIEQIVVKLTGGGLPVLVRDVAKVQEGKAIRYGALVHEDKGEVAGAVVLMLKGANAYAVVQDIKSKLDVIEHSLPEGVTIETFYDRTKVVDRAIKTVVLNLSEGALIVVFILVLFLGNLRAGLIVASVIPLSMLFAICMMNLFGVSGNLMSLGALDFGLIVDGAVIIVEAVLHRLHHKKSFPNEGVFTQERMDAEVQSASGKMMNAAVFGQIIILIVYLPILTLAGIEGKMFRPMAQTVSFALIGAFLLSLTYIPMMSALWLKKQAGHQPNFSDKIVGKLRSFYRPLLEWALRKPAPILGGALILFVTALFILSRLGGEFIPELEEGDFAVDTRLMPGTSLTHTVEVAQQVAGKLKREFPEVERIVTRVGASEIPTDPMPMEMSDVIILLKPKEQWTSASSYDELADKMSETLEDFPGLTAGFQFPIQMRFNELISGARQDVVCKLFGEDLDSLTLYAGRLAAMVHDVDGVNDLYLETVTGLPQIQVVYKREALARYGASVNEANRVVQAAFAGSSAGLVYENERRYDLVVRLKDDFRNDVENIRNMLIPAGRSGQIPLYLLADVDIEEGPNQIQRENAMRRIIVSFNVRGRDVESVVHDVQSKVNAQLRFPPGYTLHYGGAFENLEEASQRLSIAVPMALLLILFLLYTAFKSLGPGLIIFSAIPLSAIGGIIALWLRGMPFSISAGIGFIALFGVSVLNGIVLLTEIRRMQHHENMSLYTAIVEGCISRLRPVLMTAAVASFGFLPMALSQRAGAEVQRPLATVVIAGLISSTILTLFVLPILYQWMEKRKLKPGKIVSAIIIMLLPIAGIAQRPVPLQEALQVLGNQHPEVIAAAIEASYQETLKGTARTLPKTMAEMEGGQNEGPNFDLRVSALQSFQPIGLASRKMEFYEAQYGAALLQSQLMQRDIHRMVKHLYNQYAAGEAQLRAYRQLDSTIAQAVRISERRLQAGETDRMETTNLELIAVQWQQEMMMMQTRLNGLSGRLTAMMRSEISLYPAGDWNPSISKAMLTDAGALESHPIVQLREQEFKSSQMNTKVEKAMNNAEWAVGLNTISVTGWQTSKDGLTETFFDIGNRFFSGTVGLQVPIFAKGQKAKVAAAVVQEKMAANRVDIEKFHLQTAYNQTLAELQGTDRQLKHFEKESLPRIEAILQVLQRKLNAGGINYLEFNVALQQVIHTRLQYIELQRLLGEKIIDLEYFTQ